MNKTCSSVYTACALNVDCSYWVQLQKTLTLLPCTARRSAGSLVFSCDVWQNWKVIKPTAVFPKQQISNFHCNRPITRIFVCDIVCGIKKQKFHFEKYGSHFTRRKQYFSLASTFLRRRARIYFSTAIESTKMRRLPRLSDRNGRPKTLSRDKSQCKAVTGLATFSARIVIYGRPM